MGFNPMITRAEVPQVASHDGGRTAKGGRAIQSESLDITASSLVKANTNGNPGFSVRIENGRGSESCQGTLIRATDSTCTVALAAHCLYHSIAGSSDRVSLNQPACGSVKGQSAKR